MSNWKEHPHLFANGKFKVRVELASGEIKDTEYVGVNKAAVRKFDRIDHTRIYPYKILKLIARPIEDMTDEEIEQLIKADSTHVQGLQYQVSDLKDDIIELCKNGHLTRGQFLNLLSIGVYPFDQDDEDVIFEPKQ